MVREVEIEVVMVREVVREVVKEVMVGDHKMPFQ